MGGMQALSGLLLLVAALTAQGLVMMAALQLWAERRWRALPDRAPQDRSNAKAWAGYLGGQALLGPAFGAATILVVNRCGGGWIVLPSQGWGLAVGAGAYLLAMDFAEYAFHRAQHAIPWLWELHSLHHSDTTFDATTTVRHFWLDPFLKGISVWLAVGLLFKATAVITGIYAVISLYNFVIHSNTRLDFGRCSWALNAPAYHRIHHSASEEHFDVNFAALLPIFDVIFGGYRPARPGELPATGLDTGRVARTWIEVLAWPLAQRLRRSSGVRAV
jgi:sterol desaturase/sphingolipid hydroxylase (fatty acid hydroxylase superfamily)